MSSRRRKSSTTTAAGGAVAAAAASGGATKIDSSSSAAYHNDLHQALENAATILPEEEEEEDFQMIMMDGSEMDESRNIGNLSNISNAAGTSMGDSSLRNNNLDASGANNSMGGSSSSSRRSRRISIIKDKRKNLKPMVRELSTKESVTAQNKVTGETALHVGLRTKAPTACMETMLNADTDGEAVKTVDLLTNSLPIHLAIIHQADIFIIEKLIYANRCGLKVGDDKGRTPLHLCFDHMPVSKINEKMITAVLTGCPQAIHLKDKWGRTPLHTAIQFQAPLSVIVKLNKAAVEAVQPPAGGGSSSGESKVALQRKDIKGRTPLHLAIEKKVSNEIIFAILDAFPKAVIEVERQKRNPLHYAMEYEAPLIVVERFIEASPKNSRLDKTKKALVMQDCYGLTPLALGILQMPQTTTTGAMECLMCVLDAAPKMIKITDNDKRLPLHIAMEHYDNNNKSTTSKRGTSTTRRRASNTSAANNNTSNKTNKKEDDDSSNNIDSIVSILLQKYPQAAKGVDKWQRTPLHIGMEFGTPANIVHILVDKFPKATELMDDHHRYPIHLAMRLGTTKEVLQMILEASSASAKKKVLSAKDKFDHTPLHEALARQASLDCVQLLLDACCSDESEVIMDIDKSGRNCLHWGLEKGALGEVIDAVLQKSSDCAKTKDSEGNTPLHVGMKNKATLDAIKPLLKHKPQLVNYENNAKRTPYQVGRENNASKECMEFLKKVESSGGKNIIEIK